MKKAINDAVKDIKKKNIKHVYKFKINFSCK